MNDKTEYQTTDKGRAELAAKPGLLKPGMKGLLAAVGDSANAEGLRVKFPKAGDIAAGLAQLMKDGYIEPRTGKPQKPAAAAAHAGSLDTLFNEKPKEPTIQQLQRAEQTLSGARRLKAGYQISIINRPGKPLVPNGGAGQPYVVLLIDSHEAEALEAARCLMQGGLDVRGASARAEIVAALNRKPLPDLIIMDVDLTDLVGLDLLGKFREHPEMKETPIIVVTARAERDDVVAALAYGASGYLNKPIKPEALLLHVKEALGIL